MQQHLTPRIPSYIFYTATTVDKELLAVGEHFV